MLDLVLPAIVGVLAEFGHDDADGLALAIATAVIEQLEVQDDSLRMALIRSVALARAEGHLAPHDEAAIVAAAQLARKIDLTDKYFAELERDAAKHRLRPPSQDNVSQPSFLKYLEALGLTPAARKEKTTKSGGAGGGRVAAFRQREQSARAGRSA